MFRFLTRRFVPVVAPVVGVVCIGKYFYEENNNQQKYSSSRRCPMDSTPISRDNEEEKYKDIMFNYFFH